MSKHFRAFSVSLCLCGVLAAWAIAQSSADFDSGAEKQVLNELNASRAQAGLPPLKLDPKLTEAARRHALLLQQHRQVLHHFPGEPDLPDRLRATGVLFTKTAENVGMNSDIHNVNDMFLASPGHRANMLNPTYTYVGVAVVSDDSAFWITEDFATETPTLSAEEAENKAAAALESQWKQVHPAPLQLQRLTMEGLRSIACQAAAQRKLPVNTVSYDHQESRQLAAYSTPNPSELSSLIAPILSAAQLRGYAVAACTPQQAGDSGQFWMVVAFF